MGRAGTECECGLPKARGAICCDRCDFLDGSKPRSANLIAALRNVGCVATLRTLVLELGITWRKVNEALAIEIAKGRIQRIETGTEYQKNECSYVLIDRMPVKAVRPGSQVLLPRFAKYMMPEQPAARMARAKKAPLSEKPAEWQQLVARLVAMRAKKVRPPVVCDHIVDEQTGERCRTIVYGGKTGEHMVEAHGAEPPAPPKVPDVLPGQLAWC